MNFPPPTSLQLERFEISNKKLQKYAYHYKYDKHGNQTYKRLPGSAPIYMGFDKTNRMVLSQDGNQRTKNHWTLYKYDALGRLLYTSKGVFFHSYVHCRDGLKNFVITESFSNNTPTHQALNTGYTNNHFHLHSKQLYSVNYYDSYAFLNKLAPQIKTQLEYDSSKENEFGAQHPSARGLTTGTRSYRLDSSGEYTATAIYYDFRGLPIQTRSTNHMGGFDITYNQYNFSGQLTKTPCRDGRYR